MKISNLKKLNIKQRLIFSSIVAIFVCFLIYLLIHFTILEIKKLKQDIVDQEVDIERQAEREENMTRTAQKLKLVEPRLIKFENIFINLNRELEFITKLEEIASLNKIDQKINLPPLVENDKNTFKKLNLSITAQGSFRNIVEYLTMIESLNYYVNINMVDMSYQKSEKGSARVISGAGDDALIPIYEEEKNILLKLSADTYWK